MSIRVAIVDDHTLVREGFRRLLESEADIRVVGEVGDGIQAIELARRLKPDVLLMDIRMPRLDGLAATRKITSGTAPAGHPHAECFGHISERAAVPPGYG